MRRVNYIWLLPSAVCTLLGYVVRSVRWHFILSGQARAPVTMLFPILIMGFATNNLLPGTPGRVLARLSARPQTRRPQVVGAGIGVRRARVRRSDARRAAGHRAR